MHLNINDHLIELSAKKLWLQRGTMFRRSQRGERTPFVEEAMQRMQFLVWLKHEDCNAWNLYR
jgi:hypothetical protein